MNKWLNLKNALILLLIAIGISLVMVASFSPKIIIVLLFVLILSITTFVFPLFGIAFNFAGTPIIAHVLYISNVESGALVILRLLLFISVIRLYYKESFRFNIKQYSLIIYVVILMAFMLFVGLLYSHAFQYGLTKAVRFVAFNLTTFLVVISVKWDKVNIKELFISIGYIGAFIGWLSLINISYNGLQMNTRVAVLENVNWIWISRVQGLALIAIYGLIRILKINQRMTLLLLLSTPSIVLGMLLTGSRGPILAVIISIGLIELFKKKRNFTQIITLAIGLLLIMGLSLYFASTTLSNLRFFVNPTDAVNDVSTLHRLISWYTSIELISENFLLGIGTGGFWNIAEDLFPWLGKSLFRYPHNIFIEIFLENGFFAFLLFDLFIYLSIFQYKKLNRQPNTGLQAIILSFFAYTVINAQISGDITMNEGIWFSAALLIKTDYS